MTQSTPQCANCTAAVSHMQIANPISKCITDRLRAIEERNDGLRACALQHKRPKPMDCGPFVQSGASDFCAVPRFAHPIRCTASLPQTVQDVAGIRQNRRFGAKTKPGHCIFLILHKRATAAMRRTDNETQGSAMCTDWRKRSASVLCGPTVTQNRLAVRRMQCESVIRLPKASILALGNLHGDAQTEAKRCTASLLKP